MIVFERLMARLDERWVLKGGYALQLRTGQARTTQDVDLHADNISKKNVHKELQSQLSADLGDYFSFQIQKPVDLPVAAASKRFAVVSLLAGRRFEQFHIDVGFDDRVLGTYEKITPPNFLSFAGVRESTILSYPVSQHLAEKLHAIIQDRSIESSRAKDMVDILLFASIGEEIQAEEFYQALESVFKNRNTELPDRIKNLHDAWRGRFLRMAKETDLPYSDFDEARLAVGIFVNPVLSRGVKKGRWSAARWMWEQDDLFSEFGSVEFW